MKIRHLTFAFAFAACAMTAAHAGQTYVGAGTSGFELGYAHAFGGSTSLRGEFNYLRFSRDFNTGDANYSAKLKLSNLGAYVDYHPFGSFRLTGGVLLGSRSIEGSAVTTGGTVTINGTAYPVAAGEGVTVSDKFPTVAPYLGIGFGHRQSGPGWGMYFDAGAAFGKGDVSLNVTPGLAATAGADNIEAERVKIQDDLDQYKVYPIVKFGLSYTY